MHATVIAFWGRHGWRAALLRGPSGAGKSDLALRAMAAGGRLVCDDRAVVWTSGGRLYARSPSTLAGLIEIRGLGVIPVPVPVLPMAQVALVVDLANAAQDVERVPAPDWETIGGARTRRISLFPLEPSAPAKLAFAVAAATLGAEAEPAYQAQSADEAEAPDAESGASQEE